jgi:ADP-ribose pyrophosphatase
MYRAFVQREDLAIFVDHPGTACAICFTEDNQILLLRIDRPDGRSALEIPGGVKEREESSEQTMRREVLEETGYVVTTSRLLGKISTSVGITNEIVDLFVCSVVENGVGEHEVLKMPLAAINEMVLNGQIIDCKTIASLFWISSSEWAD